MSMEEQMRKTKLMTAGDPSRKHAKLIYKHIKTAPSLRSVHMDNYILVIIDSEVTPGTERDQPQVIGSMGQPHIPAFHSESSSHRFLPFARSISERGERISLQTLWIQLGFSRETRETYNRWVNPRFVVCRSAWSLS
jgi:hypothetical protein